MRILVVAHGDIIEADRGSAKAAETQEALHDLARLAHEAGIHPRNEHWDFDARYGQTDGTATVQIVAKTIPPGVAAALDRVRVLGTATIEEVP